MQSFSQIYFAIPKKNAVHSQLDSSIVVWIEFNDNLCSSLRMADVTDQAVSDAVSSL